MTWYVGIDPGVSGAVAFIRPDGTAEVHDTPYAGGDYLGPMMREILQIAADALVLDGQVVVSIERPAVHTRGAGSASAASRLKQGRGIGLWEGMVIGLRLPYELVQPPSWRARVGVPKGADKNASRAIAMRLFPQLAPQLQRVKDDGRADALLIAEAARRSREGATK